MNYQITSDNMQVSESMKELAQAKFSKLEPRFDQIPDDAKSVRIVMNSAPVEQFQVKIDLNADGTQFFVEEVNYTLETTLVNAVEELERQVEKSKFGQKDWEEKREAKRFSPDEE